MFGTHDIIRGMIRVHVPCITGKVKLIETIQAKNMIQLTYHYVESRDGVLIPYEMERLMRENVLNNDFDMSWDTDIKMGEKYVVITLKEDE